MRHPDLSMADHFAVSEISRDRRLVAMIGCAAFATSYILFHFMLPVHVWAAALPEPVVSALCSFFTAAWVMLLALLAVSRRIQVNNKRMRIAINNMSQGLCMFDGNERLVVCNQRYIELYNLSSDVVKPGCTLAGLLQHRIANGSFSRDPDQYRLELVASMAQGQTTHTELKSAIGWLIIITTRPMADLSSVWVVWPCAMEATNSSRY